MQGVLEGGSVWSRLLVRAVGRGMACRAAVEQEACMQGRRCAVWAGSLLWICIGAACIVGGLLIGSDVCPVGLPQRQAVSGQIAL
jgi:hypothetical protein